MIAAIGREVPARPGYRSVRAAVGRARSGAFVDGIEDPTRRRRGTEITSRSPGESRHALRGAYRLGARLAWEHFVAAGERPGLSRAPRSSTTSTASAPLEGQQGVRRPRAAQPAAAWRGCWPATTSRRVPDLAQRRMGAPGHAVRARGRRPTTSPMPTHRHG
jgi:hypothetical protein